MTVYAADVVKAYGEVRVLNGFHLQIRAGTVCALLGPNGAGKTTAVRILTTLLRPDSGRVEVAGVDVLRRPREARRHLGLVGQQTAVDEVLGARENLMLFARLHHLSRPAARRRAAELLEQFGIADTGSRAVRDFSGGMRRRLDLAAALILHPEVLFLDEPTVGLDPLGRRELWDVIRRLVAEGTTVLLTTQYLEEAEQLADDVCVLDGGQVQTRGTPEELTAAVGGDRLEVVLPDPARALEAAAVAEHAAAGLPSRRQSPVPGGESARITVPVRRHSGAVGAVVRALDEAGIAVDDVILRHTTLDEAYLRIAQRGRRAAGSARPEEAAQAAKTEVSA